MIINSATLSDLFVAFRAEFNRGFRDAPAQWSRIATLVPSSTQVNHYAWLGQFPRIKEWIGDRTLMKMAAHGYTITEKPWEATIEVDRDAIETDQYGIYSPLMAEMGHAAATHPDELIFGLLADGHNQLAYDGQNFFDTDHPVAGASVANYAGGGDPSWFLLDLSRPLRPLIFQRRKDYMFQSMTREDDEAVFMRKSYRYGVDARANVGFGFWQQAYASSEALDATNFKAARAAMKAFTSDEGRPLGVKPTAIVVGPSKLDDAEALFKTAANAAGAGNTLYQAVEIIESPWLA